MSRWFLALWLASASAAGVAMADPAATIQAQSAANTVENRVAQLTSQRAQLAKAYADQLEAVDKLKKQRASWRRDRELRDSLAAANDTATKLAAVTGDLARANSQLAAARRSLGDAVAAELATKPAPARAADLARLQKQLAPAAPTAPHRIVIPDVDVDPTADPEELEAQAAALRESEVELNRQVVGLEKQAKDLDEVAKLRKAHERASDLARRDDDQPARAAQSGGSAKGLGNDAAAPESGGAGGGASSGGGSTGPSSLSGDRGFESEATVVLSGVVDSATIDTLARAQRSGDPAQRALAAKAARDAVATRLDQLKKKRAEIEALVRARRGTR